MNPLACTALGLAVVLAGFAVALCVGWLFMRGLGLVWESLLDYCFLDDAARGLAYLAIVCCALVMAWGVGKMLFCR